MFEFLLSPDEGLEINGELLVPALREGEVKKATVPRTDFVHVVVLKDSAYGAVGGVLATGLFLISPWAAPETVRPLVRPEPAVAIEPATIVDTGEWDDDATGATLNGLPVIEGKPAGSFPDLPRSNEYEDDPDQDLTKP